MVDREGIQPLLDSIGGQESLEVRLAGLEAATRFDLDDDAWKAVGSAVLDAVRRAAPGSGARRRAIALAARNPLASVRAEVEAIGESADDLDAANARMALNRPSAADVDGCLQAAESDDDADAAELLALLPIETVDYGDTRRQAVIARLGSLASAGDADVAFWAMLALARLGDTGPLDRFLEGQGPEPSVFWGSPWAAYDTLASLRPVPAHLADHLRRWLEANPQPQRDPALLAWAITGTRDAEGTPLREVPDGERQGPTPGVPADSAPPSPSRAARPRPSAWVTLARRRLSHQSGSPEGTEGLRRFVDQHSGTWRARALAEEILGPLLDESGGDEYRVDPALLDGVDQTQSSALLTDAFQRVTQEVVQRGGGRDRRTVTLGNRLVDLASQLPESVDLPVSEIYHVHVDVLDEAIPADQTAWVMAKARPPHLIRQLASGLGAMSPTEKISALEMLGFAGDFQRGGVAPLHLGAGPMGGGPMGAAPAAAAGSEDFEVIDDLSPAGDEPVTGDGLGAGGDTAPPSPAPSRRSPSWDDWEAPASPAPLPPPSGPPAPASAAPLPPPFSVDAPDALPGEPVVEDPGLAMAEPAEAAAGTEADEPAEAVADTAEATVTAWPRLDAPPAVVAGRPFDIEVGLGEIQDVALDGTGAIPVPAADFTLGVELLIDGFAVRGDRAFTLKVTAARRYPTRKVTLVALQDPDLVERRRIGVVYRIGREMRGYAGREIVVKATEADLAAVAEPATEAPAPPQPGHRIDTSPFTAPGAADLTIIIQHGDTGDGSRLIWSAASPHVDVSLPDQPAGPPLGRSAQEFLEELVAEASTTTGALDLFASLLGHGRAKIAPLIPTFVRDALRRVAAEVAPRSPTVLLLSQDPYVPWELAVLDPLPSWPAGGSPFLGAQAVIGRWVLSDQPPPAVEPPKGLTIRDEVVVSGVYEGVPDWQRLYSAEREAEQLRKRWPGAHPVDASLQPVLECLGGAPAADIIHFALHGEFSTESASQGLVLIGSVEGHPDQRRPVFLRPSHVDSGRLPRGPLVFLNACQVGAGRLVLGNYSGMASAFVRVGAAAVIAPLWSVDDEEASAVALEFYSRAIDGSEAPAEVLRANRALVTDSAVRGGEAKGAGTRLAYQFFGHPNLRLGTPGTGP